MINRTYLRAYALSFTFAYCLALLSANLVLLAMQQNWLLLIILVFGPVFSILPFFYQPDLIPKDCATTFSSLPRRIQVLSKFYRILVLYIIPFFMMVMLEKHFSLVLFLACLYSLVLMMQTVVFPYGMDDFSSRMMACCLPMILSGFTGSLWSVLLLVLVVPFMLSGITFFLLMHNYLNHKRAQAVQFIKIAVAANVRVFIPAGFLALVASFLVYALMPNLPLLPSGDKVLTLDAILPEVFGSKVIGLLLYVVAGLIAGLVIIKMLTRYLKKQANRKLASSGADYEIESFKIKSLRNEVAGHNWTGVRLRIIANYLAVRRMLKRMEERFGDSLAPGELAEAVGVRFPRLEKDFGRLTQVFQWARYSASEPKPQEADIAEELASRITSYLKELK